MPFEQFDRSRLRLESLGTRQHDLDLSCMLPVDSSGAPELNARAQATINLIAGAIRAAREKGAPVVLMMGGHVIRAGVSRLLIDLARRGVITHFAGNGAVAIHDFEFALIGATTESVARYIRSGQFGLWRETGWLNDAAVEARRAGIGWGEAIGRMINAQVRLDTGSAFAERNFPHRDISLAAACDSLGVPFTVHAGIGYDIVHEHPNCDGEAMGWATYADFLVFARTIESLEEGVLINAGSAVMGPEVYLKALAMARNVAHQEGRTISRFTTAVFDLAPLDDDYQSEAAKSDPRYFFRPWKTILVRTVADGGTSHYVCGDHRATLSALWRALSKDADFETPAMVTRAPAPLS